MKTPLTTLIVILSINLCAPISPITGSALAPVPATQSQNGLQSSVEAVCYSDFT